MDKQLIKQIALEVADALDEGDTEACIEFATLFLARIDAERGKGAAAWNYELENAAFNRLIANGINSDAPLFLSPTIPEGWALVPVEPTTAMIEAGNDGFRNPDSRRHTVSSCYRAMLAAAQGERNDD